MSIVQTADLTPHSPLYYGQVYNGLDCCLTFEIHDELLKLGNSTPKVYDFERALQAPVLEMMLGDFELTSMRGKKGLLFSRARLKSSKSNSTLSPALYGTRA